MSRVLAFISMLFAMSQVQRSPAKAPACPRPVESGPFPYPSHLYEQALVLSAVGSSVQASRAAGSMTNVVQRSTSAVKAGCSCLACTMRSHTSGCSCADCSSCQKFHSPSCLCGTCA